MGERLRGTCSHLNVSLLSLVKMTLPIVKGTTELWGLQSYSQEVGKGNTTEHG